MDTLVAAKHRNMGLPNSSANAVDFVDDLR